MSRIDPWPFPTNPAQEWRPWGPWTTPAFEVRPAGTRYALLAGPVANCPEGWLAFRGFYATADAACVAAATWKIAGHWWQVVDLEAGVVVASGRDGL